MAASQQDTVEATAKALESVGGQIQQVRDQGEQRHAESSRRFTEGLEENRKEQERRHQESMGNIGEKMEGAHREQQQAVQELKEEVRDTKADIESRFQELNREIEAVKSRGNTPLVQTPRSGARSPEFSDHMGDWYRGIGEPAYVRPGTLTERLMADPGKYRGEPGTVRMPSPLWWGLGCESR